MLWCRYCSNSYYSRMGMTIVWPKLVIWTPNTKYKVSAHTYVSKTRILDKQAILLPKFDKSSLVSQAVELQSYYTPAYPSTTHQTKLNQNPHLFANISSISDPTKRKTMYRNNDYAVALEYVVCCRNLLNHFSGRFGPKFQVDLATSESSDLVLYFASSISIPSSRARSSPDLSLVVSPPFRPISW